MRRYWLFAGCGEQATGGMKDYKCSFNTIEEGIEAGKAAAAEIWWRPFWHLFDLATGRIVAEGFENREEDDGTPIVCNPLNPQPWWHVARKEVVTP